MFHNLDARLNSLMSSKFGYIVHFLSELLAADALVAHILPCSALSD